MQFSKVKSTRLQTLWHNGRIVPLNSLQAGNLSTQITIENNSVQIS